MRKGTLRNSQAQACNFIKKETLTQVFSCEFCKISKNTFFTEHIWATASILYFLRMSISSPFGKKLGGRPTKPYTFKQTQNAVTKYHDV